MLLRIVILVSCLQFSIQDLFCQDKRPAYFEIHKKFPCPTCPVYTADLSKLPLYNEKSVNEAFKFVLESKMETNYPQGGCQNRAHFMSMLLSKQLNLQHGKIWLFAPANIEQNSNAGLEIDDKNKLAPNDVILWNYHVAPFILVKNGSQLDTFVIDPSLHSAGPVKLSAWFSLMRRSEQSYYTLLDPEWYFFMMNGKLLSGEFYRFSVDNRYCADNYRNLTLEKGLAINDMVIYILQKYLVNLRNSTNPEFVLKYQKLRRVFGNVDALVSLFGNLSSYCGATVPDNLSLKEYQHEFREIMTDALTFYTQRVVHWIDEVRKVEH